MHTGIQRFELNPAGRDFAVGDIHGSFTQLQQALDVIGFDPAIDRLFSVGDIVDRGAESTRALEWLAKPWFHAIQGNHEVMSIWGAKGNMQFHDTHMLYGGEWLYDLSPKEQAKFSHALEQMPLIIEVQTAHGVVGLVHADFPFDDWKEMDRENINRSETEMCQWSRQRFDHLYEGQVRNIRAVVHGHTPVHEMVVLGNCFFIDTAGWLLDQEGFFTFLELKTLLPHTIASTPDEG